jgi:IclR family transcriptional regulator, pca regulon regulatory protein
VSPSPRRVLADGRVEGILRALSVELSFTVGIAVLEGTEIKYIVCAQRIKPVTWQTDVESDFGVGAKRPAYCTAAGKVLLAHAPHKRVEVLLRNMQLEPRGINTIIDIEGFRSELLRVRRRGIAVEDQERGDGFIAIAAPIRNNRKRVIAALDLSAHTARSTVEEMIEIGKLDLLGVAEWLSHILGYPIHESF